MWIDSGRSHVKGFSLLFFLWLIAIHWSTYEMSFCKFCLLYMSIKIVLLSCCFHIVFFLMVFLIDLVWKNYSYQRHSDWLFYVFQWTLQRRHFRYFNYIGPHEVTSIFNPHLNSCIHLPSFYLKLCFCKYRFLKN